MLTEVGRISAAPGLSGPEGFILIVRGIHNENNVFVALYKVDHIAVSKNAKLGRFRDSCGPALRIPRRIGWVVLSLFVEGATLGKFSFCFRGAIHECLYLSGRHRIQVRDKDP